MKINKLLYNRRKSILKSQSRSPSNKDFIKKFLSWKNSVLYYTIKSISNLIRHPFHLVDESPWPILASITALGLTSGLINWFHFNSSELFLISTTLILLITAQWWRDVRREGSYMGQHSGIVELGLRWGIILFIVSEIFFFIRFFWAFFHSRLAVNIEIGSQWPPSGNYTL